MFKLKMLIATLIFSTGIQAGLYPVSYMYQISNPGVALVIVDNFGDNYSVCLDIAIMFNKEARYTKFACHYNWSA